MKINIVQIIIFGLAGIFVLIALGIFTGALPGLRSDRDATTETSIWIPERYYDDIKEIISRNFKEAERNISVSIIKIPDETYEEEIINALASQNAPEIWFFPHEWLVQHQDKAALIPFTSISERTFLDTFIDAGELYLKRAKTKKDSSGIRALPFGVDPLVLYWNKDLFSSAAISKPPKTWGEFISYAQRLTTFDSSRAIVTAGAALGEFGNITHVKDIISLFILQTGNPIVDAKTLKATLEEKFDMTLNPAAISIRFFNEFSNPRKITYSWNHNMPDAFEAFIAQKLAMYIGYASEYRTIIKKSPHLNFDVAEIPQILGGAIQATYGTVDALAISKNAARSDAAFKLVTFLISTDIQTKIQEETLRPSVLRDVLASPQKNPIISVFSASAVKTRNWLDPDPRSTYDIFKNMVQSVKIGQKEPEKAVKDANTQLQDIISNI